ncbi:prepilin-type N-terminal cleavage/methylation domain-containing protein [Candidatus Saccharibacteria bacterium]|nr:prepilin-type N-terminal cleavage/methylation domain-containing protein [Candidatus Saccharibacteria bacterium]
MKLRHRPGFTIVELLVVIVAISILATVTIVGYRTVQMQARDTQIRSAAEKFAGALELWSAKHNNTFPQGGSVTSGTLSTPDGPNGCTAGGTNGWANSNYAGTSLTYPCTVGQVMVYGGYLPADFFTKLPNNTRYNNNLTNYMVYRCYNDEFKRRLLLYALEEPTQQERDTFASTLNSCGMSGSISTLEGYGMRALIEITFA